MTPDPTVTAVSAHTLRGMAENHSNDEVRDMGRVICWFSCGDASAVACKLAIKKYGARCVVVRIVLTTEHDDNNRFSRACEKWFGRPVLGICSTEHRDTWDVWEKRKYIAGIAGAPCTTELKKSVRHAFQLPDDLHIFGYTSEEAHRAETFKANNFDVAVEYPLIDAGLTKADCHALVRDAGIELPAMYRLGFDNNNCIGCPKGGAGYWNKIRQHFPEQFIRMSELSRRVGARLVKQDGARIFLDELRTTTGRQKDEVAISCSPLCELVADEVSP